MPDTITVSMSSHQNRSGIIVLSGDWSGRMRPHPVLHSRAWPGRAREGQGGPGRASRAFNPSVVYTQLQCYDKSLELSTFVMLFIWDDNS